ncbi:MAG: hypothetical protein Q4G71_07925 [Pseudomonadota bacterium]|nr:hypothetical protein [Pseudomonadota bacterium]
MLHHTVRHLGLATALACMSLAAAAAPSAARQAPAAVESTPELAKAPWISYRCDNDKRLRVRYHYGEATARAQVLADGRSTTMLYSPDSNADITVFEGGGHKWHIENLPPGQQARAKAGMLTRSGTQMVNKRRTAVDDIVRKGCDPVR